MKRIFLYIVIVATMYGCNVYKKYEPIKEVDENLFGKEYLSSDTSSIANLSWKEVFKDAYLQRLIDTALVRNTDLKTAYLRVQQAESVLLASRMAYLPSVSLTAEGNVCRLEGTTTKAYNISPLASWEIDIFGKITASKREALSSLQATKEYKQAVKTSLIASVANSYYSLLMLDEQIRISEQTLESWQATINTLQALLLAGETNETAVLQAKANFSSLEADILSLRKSIKENENALCLLLAQTPQSIERGKLANQTILDTFSIGLPLQLLANRPDVRQAEMNLAKAFYATNVARASFYPSITLSGSLGWTNNAGGVVSNPAQWLSNAVGSLTQPLFNRGNNIANLQNTKAEQEIASLTFQQTLLQAGNEVNNALTSLQTARQRQEINSQSVESLQQAVEKTQLLMQYSSTSYLEVLTAQQSLLSAEQSLAQDRFNEIQSLINLYHALGGGEF